MKLFDVINVKKKKNVDDTKCCCIAVAAGRGRCGGRTFQAIYFPATISTFQKILKNCSE